MKHMENNNLMIDYKLTGLLGTTTGENGETIEYFQLYDKGFKELKTSDELFNWIHANSMAYLTKDTWWDTPELRNKYKEVTDLSNIQLDVEVVTYLTGQTSLSCAVHFLLEDFRVFLRTPTKIVWEPNHYNFVDPKNDKIS